MTTIGGEVSSAITRKPRILHIITTFGTGGAEGSLRSLVPRLEKLGLSNHVAVVSGTPENEYSFPVVYLGAKRGRYPSIGVLARLKAITRKIDPDLVQGWMYHGNLFASLAGWFAKSIVAWNVRHSLYNIRSEAPLTQKVILANKWLSSRVSVIVNNSQTSVSQHEAYGFSPGKQAYIPNGFDCERFSPVPKARQRLCRELRLDDDVTIIGMVARYHPIKDHDNLLRAMRNVVSGRPNVFLVLVGHGMDTGNGALKRIIQSHAMESRCILLGERSDTPDLHSGFDISVLSSYSEGFPNVVGESMACKTPCVVTDVGDAAHLVGRTGRVVAPKDSSALTQGIQSLLSDPSLSLLGEAARSRIVTEFSIASVSRRYDALYRSLVSTARLEL